MGILGSVELVKRTREIVVGYTQQGEPFTLTVRAPSLNLAGELRTKITDPKPPAKRDEQGRVKLKRNPSTGELVKNSSGQAIPELDHSNPDYLRDVRNVERARTIAMILECVDFPGEFKTVKNGMSAVEFELARWAELEEAGVDVGAYKSLSDAVVELSEPMTRSEIEEARIALGTDKETQDKAKESLGKKAPKGK